MKETLIEKILTECCKFELRHKRLLKEALEKPRNRKEIASEAFAICFVFALQKNLVTLIDKEEIEVNNIKSFFDKNKPVDKLFEDYGRLEEKNFKKFINSIGGKNG